MQDPMRTLTTIGIVPLFLWSTDSSHFSHLCHHVTCVRATPQGQPVPCYVIWWCDVPKCQLLKNVQPGQNGMVWHANSELFFCISTLLTSYLLYSATELGSPRWSGKSSAPVDRGASSRPSPLGSMDARDGGAIDAGMENRIRNLPKRVRVYTSM